MTAMPQLDVQDLVKLARDKSQKGRTDLVTALNDLYFDDGQLLTDQDRAIMADIMRELVHEVEMSVRRSLAHRMAERADAPRELVVKLANDAIEVAHPILIRSEVLRDIELIEIVQQRTMEHQLAISMRPYVSERLSDTLVETDNEEVIRTLLSNDGARIADNTMGGLVEQSQQIESFQKPLVHRRDLPQDLAKKLYWGVSAALRKHIVENYEIDRGDLDETIEGAVKDILAEEADAARRPSAPRKPPAPAEPEDEHVLIRLLRQGEIAMFLDKFTALSGLRITLVRRLLFETGGEGLAIAAKAIGLDKHSFITIFLRFRQGRLGDKQVEADELSRATDFFDRIDVTQAKALLRRWHRDPEFLNALRLVEEVDRG